MQYLRNLSFRFWLAFITIIVLTTLSAGVPAYIFIRTELDRQAWMRVADGERISAALLDAEKARLENLADLLVQRPTLQQLVQKNDLAALDQYLQTFRATVDLDVLVFSDETGQVLINGAQKELWAALDFPFAQQATFQVLSPDSPQLALVASKPIPTTKGQELYISVGITLDDDYAANLARETGFDHSFLMDDLTLSSSLEDVPSTVVIADAIQQVIASGKTERVQLDSQDAHYYVALVPLTGEQGKVVGISQVILPIENLLTANRNALLTLVFSTLFVAIVTSGLAGYFSQRLTTPLKELTNAALKISQGDYTTPVPVIDSPTEIAALAKAIENSRKTTLLAITDLSRAKSWFETLIQSVVEGIITLDAQGKVTLFNKGAEQITGWKAAEVLGTSIHQILPFSDGKDDFLSQNLLSGRIQHLNTKTCNGEEIVLSVTCAPLQSSPDGTDYIALVIRDISQEEAVRRLRSYFMANISHEFRTPLAAINASVELLLGDLEEFTLAEIAELLNSIHFSVTSLQTLIDNLLESTSIEAGRFRIHCRSTDLGEVITNALQMMSPLLERRQQNLSLAIPTQLPKISADPTRLVQVLVNLLSNASKYSPLESTIELHIKIENGRTLHCSVSDQGPGVPQSERSKLYSPFMRLGETEITQHSIGLGLSVVKAIIEAHHGEVGMDDRAEGGAIFWFTIPIQEAL